jgi:uncharacterized protein (TIGR02453 family)
MMNDRKTARFDRDTFRFLEELAAHNERPWFNANKHRYEAHVLEPALSFIEAMAPRLERISPHFIASAKRSGGSLIRIYRDTRFARIKLPYKTNIGIHFRHERGRDAHAPGFYVHIEPRGCFLGLGIWRPESSVASQIRQEIFERPDAWRKASRSKRFTDHFELTGNSLQRPPRGFPADATHIEDLRRKDFIGVARLAQKTIMRRDFPDHLSGLFKRGAPIMGFLCGALDLAF